MVKRIFLFLAVNILVLITISITLRVFNVQPYLNGHGIKFGALLVFCGIVGFAGAFISLALSRIMAKMMLGVVVIDPARTGSPVEADLVATVGRLAQAAGLPMPEVGIYESPELNAFATGPTKSRALVAVSSGLLRGMGRQEIEGVLGHEMTHIANGDMVTMTLLQGVVNTFVMFLARVAAFTLSSFLRGERQRGGGISYMLNWVFVIAFEIAFSLLGAIVVMWFSRMREYRADAGGAHLAGREKMIGALEALKRAVPIVDNRAPSLANFKINGGRRGLLALWASHPDLDDRITRLREMRA